MTSVTIVQPRPTERIIYIVNTHGWHVMKIMPKSQDPGSAFTIGLSCMCETVALRLTEKEGRAHDADSARRYDPETVDFSDPALPPV